ncbi:hypothetical protein GUJ93_ZPchr0012g18923 [Zizania palustris]|uniref:Uncharacterized protein n=1 Tax=Zizania palustris TaxID=103762 RepID=A0A8J5WP57_ZIZPA|nr:hypothetical protein GUJ93_ZPchr0012g18923 [Zizania palustris]
MDQRTERDRVVEEPGSGGGIPDKPNKSSAGGRMSTDSERERPAPGRPGEQSGDHRRQRRLMNAESARTDEEDGVPSLGSSSASPPRWRRSGRSSTRAPPGGGGVDDGPEALLELAQREVM